MLAAHRTLLANAAYMPKLSWKKGELDAFRTTRPAINQSTIPIFVMPPAGSFDHDAGRITSPAEHVRLFGPRLREARQDLPVFVDANYLDDERHKVAFNVHPLTALLERARLTRSQAWPLTSYGRSHEYQEAVARFHHLHGSPVAMQISLSDLGAAGLSTRLTSLCNQVSCDPSDAVLVIDVGPLHLADEQQEQAFLNILIPILNELPNLYDWSQIVLSATSLSDPQKIKTGETKFIRRSEWHIYRSMIEREGTFLNRLPIFSDCGVEFRKSLAPIKARPTAKLSYTTNEGHFCVKGANVKIGGYQAIFPVAKAIVDSQYYKGADFSKGDTKILRLSEEVGGTGSAPTWKWAAVDHHLATVAQQLSIALNKPLPEPTTAPSQIEFQAELPLVPTR